MKRNWKELILESDTTVARELLRTFEEGNFEELKEALELNYESAKAGAKFELWEHLKDLMVSVFLVKLSSEFQTQEQWEKICRLRAEIEEDLEWNHNLNKNSIKEIWDKTLKSAIYLAETYVEIDENSKNLSTNEVFKEVYHPSVFHKEKETA